VRKPFVEGNTVSIEMDVVKEEHGTGSGPCPMLDFGTRNEMNSVVSIVTGL
jgi:hypothetical protein